MPARHARAVYIPLARQVSERSQQAGGDENNAEGQQGSDNGYHEDITIALAMGQAADTEEGDHGAVVRQRVESRPSRDRRDAVERLEERSLRPRPPVRR
jgi:hypothetical protein